VVLGSTVATVQKCLFGKEQEAAAALKKAGMPHKAKNLLEGEDHDESHHEVVEHPNFDDINAEVSPTPFGDQTPGIGGPTPDVATKKKKRSIGQFMKSFDAEKLKPFLIYKYDRVAHKKAK
jgi:hypothetical protein